MDDQDAFEGLALHDRLPLLWEPASLNDAVALDHMNQETARVLQAMAVFEEAPREHPTDSSATGQELQRVETKVDVLLSLVGILLGDRQAGAPRQALVLRAGSVEWSGPQAAVIPPGATGFVSVFVNPTLPLPLKLPAKIVGSVERQGQRWLLARFEHVAKPVEAGLQKLIFRRHRRQIALTRNTGIFSETGVFAAPSK